VVAGTSANAEIGTALSRLRDRARDLVRNNPYAAKAVQAVVSNLIGTGILPRARSGDVAINEMADKLWARFDPLKDIQADILAVRGGLMTLKEAIARQGYDPAHVLAEIGATNTELDALGIVLDTDRRKATKTGAAKPMEETPSAVSD
jgi:capsid protein